jgi:hypothetical protein
MPYFRSRAPYLLRRRGFGDVSYTTESTPGGDYQIVTDSSSGTQTIFDPNGNVVPSVPTTFTRFYGPVAPGGLAYVPASTYSYLNPGGPGSAAAPLGTSLSTFWAQYQTPILIGGFALLAFSILGRR